MGFVVNIDVDKNEVCRYLGYGDNARAISPSVSSLIDSQIARAYGLIKPAYTCEIKAVEGVQGQKVFVEGSLVFTGKTVSYVLSDCKKVAIFLLTIGGDLDKEVSRLIRTGEVLKATVLDAVGTGAVAATACQVEGGIEKIAGADGFQATRGYSPGQCEWDISEQEVIFRAVDSAVLGVRLTESMVMVPLKSLAGVIGIGKFDEAKPPPCLMCSRRESCVYERARL